MVRGDQLILVLLFGVSCSAAPSLSLGRMRCGQVTCQHYEYCSDNACEKCEIICEENNPSYDYDACKENCPSYVQDFVFQYLKKNDSIIAGLQDEIETLHTLVFTSLIISCILLIFAAAILGYTFLKYRRQRLALQRREQQIKKKISSVKTICNNNQTPETGSTHRLKLEMPVSGTVEQLTPPSAVTTTTPLSTRHPAEDATLEYAYDNPAMSPSPVFNKDCKPRTETSF